MSEYKIDKDIIYFCYAFYRVILNDFFKQTVDGSKEFDGMEDEKPHMTWCKQRAHLLPTRVFDIFATTNAKFFALLHFFHSCWILPH